jgi:hypothetical protein
MSKLIYIKITMDYKFFLKVIITGNICRKRVLFLLLFSCKYENNDSFKIFLPFLFFKAKNESILFFNLTR